MRIIHAITVFGSCVALACGSSDSSGDDGSTGYGGSDAGGSPAAGGSTAAGGTAAAGASDTGGAAGAATTLDAANPFAFCNDATAETGITSVATLSSLRYDHPCIKVTAGTVVTIGGSTTHPLTPMTSGTQPNPITASTTDEPVTFTDVGVFGYYCSNHGEDDPTSTVMNGAVYVVAELSRSVTPCGFAR